MHMRELIKKVASRWVSPIAVFQLSLFRKCVSDLRFSDLNLQEPVYHSVDGGKNKQESMPYVKLRYISFHFIVISS